jgi:HSP20 family protein
MQTVLQYQQKEAPNMTNTATKPPAKTEEKEIERASALETWRPLETLRRQVDRLFADFDGETWGIPFRRSIFGTEPFWQRGLALGPAPAVDILEKNGAYELTAELPGMEEKDVEVKLVNGELTIKGEKQEEKEETRKGYYRHERRFGSFERCFPVPEGVDTDKIEAHFKKGLLTVTLPKKQEARKPEKKIEVKAA